MGRAEVPDTLILDADDYRDIYESASYNDFLHSILMQHRCIFVGFSFSDPAVSRLLDFIESKRVYNKKHFACLPASAIALTERMSNQNIEVLLYDEMNDHRVLWDGILRASRVFSGQMTIPEPDLPSNFDIARRLLAVCYARTRLADDVLPLRNTVVQGIVLSEIASGTTSIEELAHRLQRYIALKAEESAGLVALAIDALTDREICMSDGSEVVLVKDSTALLSDSPAPRLARAIVDRLMVREQYDVKPEIHAALERIAEEVIVVRGFDLGAEFASSRFLTDLDPSNTIRKAIDRHLPQYWQDRKAQIAAAFLDLLRRPTSAEEELLAEVGRVSFGIEMVLQAGRATMYAASLPEVVYLDASVLMPAIVPGHPFQHAYIGALAKLQSAAEVEGSSAVVMIADVFLNEIVTHRKRAIEVIAELGLENYETLNRRIQYYGADNVNVFVGAYSTWASHRSGGTFQEFLQTEAPYSTENELAAFLKGKGIKVAATGPKSQRDVQTYEFVKTRLFDGYERAEFGWAEPERKALVLKRHEAAQVALLLSTSQQGRRAVLVTADKVLRRVAAGLGIRELRDALISHRNLVQMVDLLVGAPVDSSSLARLLWTVRVVDERAAIKDYLISRALPQYDAVLSLKMSDLLDRIVDRVTHEAELEGVKLGGNSFVERTKEMRFIDRIEGEVFAQLAEEVRKLKQELKQKIQNS